MRWGERFPLARAVELPLLKSPTASLASRLLTISVTPRQRMGRVWSTLLPLTCPSLKGPPSQGLPHSSPCSCTTLAQPRHSWPFGLDGSSSWVLSWAAELGPTHWRPVASPPPHSVAATHNISGYGQMSPRGQVDPSWEPLAWVWFLQWLS